jgi:hypothetical protein
MWLSRSTRISCSRARPRRPTHISATCFVSLVARKRGHPCRETGRRLFRHHLHLPMFCIPIRIRVSRIGDTTGGSMSRRSSGGSDVCPTNRCWIGGMSRCATRECKMRRRVMNMCRTSGCNSRHPKSFEIFRPNLYHSGTTPNKTKDAAAMSTREPF